MKFPKAKSGAYDGDFYQLVLKKNTKYCCDAMRENIGEDEVIVSYGDEENRPPTIAVKPEGYSEFFKSINFCPFCGEKIERG